MSSSTATGRLKPEVMSSVDRATVVSDSTQDMFPVLLHVSSLLCTVHKLYAFLHLSKKWRLSISLTGGGGGAC
jgi:hypothetical protein